MMCKSSSFPHRREKKARLSPEEYVICILNKNILSYATTSCIVNSNQKLSTTTFFQDLSHCVISLLIPFEEDVCTFLIFSYSFIGQQLLLKQFCSNRLSFKDSLLTSTANPAQRGRTGCAG